jgi:cobalt-zinc-cadmium efflux system protein
MELFSKSSVEAASHAAWHAHGPQGHGHHHHDEHGHEHVHSVGFDDQQRVFWVMLLTGFYMIAQAIGGSLAGSLALIADSGHMLSDTAALALAWFAFRLAARPADARRSYGYHRAQVLAAFVNGLMLFAIVVWISVEAIQRLRYPQEVLAGPMLIVAAVGLLVNLAGFLILHRGSRENDNLQGALVHVIGDLLGSVGAIAAAVIILFTGWTPIDPILSIVVACLVLRSAWGLIQRSSAILMEETPAHLDVETLRADLVAHFSEVTDVHHVHIWALTRERPIATLHAQVAEGADPLAMTLAIRTHLSTRYGLYHVTVQIEGDVCADTVTGREAGMQVSHSH